MYDVILCQHSVVIKLHTFMYNLYCIMYMYVVVCVYLCVHVSAVICNSRRALTSPHRRHSHAAVARLEASAAALKLPLPPPPPMTTLVSRLAAHRHPSAVKQRRHLPPPTHRPPLLLLRRLHPAARRSRKWSLARSRRHCGDERWRESLKLCSPA